MTTGDAGPAPQPVDTTPAHRNAIFTADGRINCEIEHADYGWIPATVAADDPATAAIYANAEPDALPAPAPVLADVKADRLAAMIRAADGEVEAIIAQYPEFERDTWDAQEREARAWTADATAATPTLDGIAAARGVTVAYLAPKVIAKADEYRTLAAAVAGRRQAREDAIDAAATVADVEAVIW